jgi:hypothetical protein
MIKVVVSTVFLDLFCVRFDVSECVEDSIRRRVT